MLHTDDQLRVEELVMPDGFAPRAIGEVLPRSPDYIVMATHERGRWVFNPSDDHVLQSGTAVVLMTNPGAREGLESLLRGT
jgi:voltage-gated potassium channel